MAAFYIVAAPVQLQSAGRRVHRVHLPPVPSIFLPFNLCTILRPPSLIFLASFFKTFLWIVVQVYDLNLLLCLTRVGGES